MEHTTLAILGRQPALGLAELESLLGADKIKALSSAALLRTSSDSLNGHQLGGAVKLAKILALIPTTKWAAIRRHLVNALPSHLTYAPTGKLTIGISVYGLSVKPAEVSATALELKKTAKQHGRSVRIVPNQEIALNSAQVLHNRLTGERGWELILMRDGEQTILAQTFFVQDIEAYAKRDQARPKRDPRVGMLPPKLAQTIINLARPVHGGLVLDPFCGSGVILQEAALMGFNIYGSDIEPRMVEYSRQNIDWLKIRYDLTVKVKLEIADATTASWSLPPAAAIATEAYLGTPFSDNPPSDALKRSIDTTNKITSRFLQNVARQTAPGFRLCVALPAWYVNDRFIRLPLLDRLSALGYNRVSFAHVKDDELIYYRTGQTVARELVVLEKRK